MIAHKDIKFGGVYYTSHGDFLVLDWKADAPMIQAQMVALRGSDEEW